MKIENIIKYAFWMLLLGNLSNISAIAPHLPEGVTDRKWDLKQMYINQLPVDSLTVADMGMSLIFNGQGRFFQLAHSDSLDATAVMEGYWSYTSSYVLNAAETVGMQNIWYGFKVTYLGYDHLVLTFTKPDLQDPTKSNLVEFRFVADNSIGEE